MRVATVDGLATLFYDGSKKLHNEELYSEWLTMWRQHDRNDEIWEDWDISDECKRQILDRETDLAADYGVTVIPRVTFSYCRNIKRVIMANTLPINIEVIENEAFYECNLSSVFIPPRCHEIGIAAFRMNENLAISHVHQENETNKYNIAETKLIEESHFQIDERYNYDDFPGQMEEVVALIRNINSNEKYSLHRACSSFQPLKEVINEIAEKKGIGSFHKKNSIGIAPSIYLKENSFDDVTEQEIIQDYIMKLMGESD